MNGNGIHHHQGLSSRLSRDPLKINFMRHSSIQQENFKAYEQQPDILRYPSTRMFDIAKDLATDLKLRFQQIVRKNLERYPDSFSKDKRLVENQSHDTPLVEIYDDLNQIRQRLIDLGYGFQSDKINQDEVLMLI